MKGNYRFIFFGVFIISFFFGILSFGFCQDTERITVDVNGNPKQYDVIETKRYELVEVDDSPMTIQGLTSIAEQAITDAEGDATAHLNRTFWFTAGFFFPVGGSLISQFYQPFMPTARVLGKSPEYIAFYYDAYKVKTKKLQFKWALAGCLIGTPLSAYLINAAF